MVYMINNVPEGFSLIKDSRSTVSVLRFWMDEVGNAIVYEQEIIVESSEIRVDNGDYEDTVIGSNTVFKVCSDGMYILMWVDHGYLFTLCCSDTIPWETIVNMVENLAPEKL